MSRDPGRVSDTRLLHIGIDLLGRLRTVGLREPNPTE